MNKRVFKAFFFFFFAFFFFGFVSLGESDSFKRLLAPLNPEFLKSMKREQPAGVVPPVDLSHVKGTLDEAVHMEYPAYYDLRKLGRVPPVKAQLAYPTCWAFAAYTSLESSLLPEEPVDLSEWHLANTHGFDYDLYHGGNSFMTTAYLVRWSGPVDEEATPYGWSTNLGRYYPLVKHVQQVIYLPEREGSLDNNTIKYFVMNDGAVDFAFRWNSFYYNPDTHGAYCPEYDDQNHRLAIVGWDDNYPAANFLDPPPGNGAFIIRNSFGEDWADKGHCYISYYDPTYRHMTCFNNGEDPINYSTNYQYDPLGQTRTWGKIESWGANVFTAENKNALEAVGFYAADAHMKYEIYIYKDIDTGTADPTRGTPAAAKNGSFVYPGYYTVRLDEKIPVRPGTTFSVVVKFINSSYPHSVPIEAPIEEHSSGADANEGESYVSLDGIQWQDLTHVVPCSNVCIKAYAEYKRPDITIEVERRTANGWFIVKDFANINIYVPNYLEVPLGKLLLYRSTAGDPYELVYEIPLDELVAGVGSCSFKDTYLEVIHRYTYQVVALDLEGYISNRSIPVTI